jgi:hypothetical protein
MFIALALGRARSLSLSRPGHSTIISLIYNMSIDYFHAKRAKNKNKHKSFIMPKTYPVHNKYFGIV